jgi:crossover junction endodeoxyribonuclease RuvC
MAAGRQKTVALGIDPGLANTGWGIVERDGSRFRCLAYGCIATSADMELSRRLKKIRDQVAAVIERYNPTCVGIETVWFGQNITAAFATGQARGAALVACADAALSVGEYTPTNIKGTVVGSGNADKHQVQYMMKQLLGLEQEPHPDHAADALAAAMCYLLNEGPTARDALR